MGKFILVKDYSMFDEIKEYIKKNAKRNYYIAPNLMMECLTNLSHRCVTGISMYDIKIFELNKIDLLTMYTYNRVFEASVFRIDGIKDFYFKKLNHEFEYESIVFGIEEDLKDFACKVEEL